VQPLSPDLSNMPVTKWPKQLNYRANWGQGGGPVLVVLTDTTNSLIMTRFRATKNCGARICTAILSRPMQPIASSCEFGDSHSRKRPIDYICTLWYIITMSQAVLNVRGVPSDLIRRAKSAAALQGITLREWVLKAIEEKLKKAK
jgi:hypothetical protein